MTGAAPATTVEDAFAQALELHRGGRLEQAADLHRAILDAAPGHADSWHLLGVIALQSGRPGQAVDLIEHAVGLREAPLFLTNLATACRAAGREDDALRHSGRAVDLKPDADALSDLGNALMAAGRVEQAADRYRAALALDSGHAAARYNLANALLRLRRSDEAIAHYHAVLALKPDLAEAHNNLGRALHERDDLDRAVECYRRALEIRPDFPEALNNLGNARLDRGQVAEALECYRRALAARPDYGDAWGNLGNALRIDGRLAESLAAAARCREFGRPARGWEVEATTRFALGDAAGTLAAYRAALADGGWPDLHSRLLMTMQYCDTATVAEIAAEAARWAARWAPAPLPVERPAQGAERPLHVGIVSGDFRLCSTPFLALPLLRHRPADWTLALYSTVRRPDAWTGVFQALADRWVDIALIDDEAAAARVRTDEVDVLIDLNGHTVGGRPGLFALKPAPVQVAWLDYVGTTGLSTFDALVGDDGHLPPADQRWYSEPIRRVRHDLYRYEPPPGAPEPAPLPAAGRGFVTFGCFNAAYKLTGPTLDLWARVLGAVPSARLLLNSREFRHRETCERLLGLFAERGVSAGRVELRAGAADPNAMLAAYAGVDVGLDPMPYSGGLTTLEALYMGVPVVTAPGDRFGSRHSAVHLRAVGLDDWIAATPDAYVARATRAAADLDGLGALRRGLRARLCASPLMDGAAFAADFGVLIRQAWRDACLSPGPRR